MTEYTRDIEQLQRTASQQPTFARPSNSLGGDLINLANTGLQFYAKQKAQSDLDIIAKQKAQQQEIVNKGVLGFRNLRNDLAGQGLNRTQILQKEASYLNQYGANERLAIISGTNDLTGFKTKDLLSDSDTQEREILARAEKAKQDREALEMDVAELSPYINTEVSLEAEDDVLRRAILQGTSKKAYTDKKKADAQLRATQLSNLDKANELDAEVFSIDYGAVTSAKYSQITNGIMDKADFNDPAQVQSLMTENSNLRRQFIQQATLSAKEKGIILSQDKAEQYLANELEMFDAVGAFLSRSDLTMMSTNTRKLKVNRLMLQLEKSEDPQARKLAHLSLLSEALGDGSEIQEQFNKIHINATIRGLGDSINSFGASTPTSTNKETVAQTLANFNKAKEYTKNIFKNADENLPTETQEAYTETILNDLNGSADKKERLMQNGGFTAYVEAIAEGKPENVIPEGKRDQVLTSMMSTSEQFLRRTVQQILNQEQLLGFEPTKYDRNGKRKASKGPKPITATGEESLNPLGDDLKLSFINPNAEVRKYMLRYNKYVDNVFTAMDKLGATEAEKDFLRNEILRSFNVASTVRDDTK